MKAYLSIFLGYGDSLNTRINLIEFDNIKDLDVYTKKFENSIEIKKIFQNDIQEFILESRFDKAYKENKNGKPIVRLVAYVYYDNYIRYIPILFKSEEILEDIKAENICINLEKTEKFNIFLQDYGYLLGNSKEVSNLKYMYKKSGQRYCYKKKILDILCVRIRRSSDDFKYFYLRTLAKICDLKIKDIEINLGLEESLSKVDKSRIHEDCNDEQFIKLIDDENYEELFKEYNLEKILIYSKEQKNPLGTRRK